MTQQPIDKIALTGQNTPHLQTKSNRSKVVAALLAIFLGDFGAHKFYLGKPIWGILYLIFAWTFIPMIIGWIEGLLYLFMSDKSFEEKYS